VAGLMLEGGFRRPGVHAPETLGRVPGLLDRLLRELLGRGVSCSAQRTVAGDAVPDRRGEPVAVA